MNYEEADLRSLAEEMQRLAEELDLISQKKTSLQKQYDKIRLEVIPRRMEDEGIDSIKLSGIGNVMVTDDVYASIPADMAAEAMQWLNDHGHGGLVKNTVNPSTLKAFAKKMIREGEPLPEEFFKVTPFSRASIRQA
jgi:hypothetical protein